MTAALGTVIGIRAAAPWRSKTFLVALLAALLGVGLWVRAGFTAPAGSGSAPARTASAGRGGQEFTFNRPLPLYARLALSYAGGFLVGWSLRRFLKITAALAVVAAALVALGKFAGMNTASAEKQVQEQSAWVQEQGAGARRWLTGLLPSTLLGGAGAGVGFRRAGRDRGRDPSNEK